jgi:hypothetical protein
MRFVQSQLCMMTATTTSPKAVRAMNAHGGGDRSHKGVMEPHYNRSAFTEALGAATIRVLSSSLCKA